MLRDFHIGDVLSVAIGRLLAPRRIEALYDILNYMTGDSLYTHQLPRATNECAPWLRRQHPWLGSPEFAEYVTRFEASLKTETRSPERLIEEWIGDVAHRFADGAMSLSVEPIPRDDHEFIDPVTELANMVGKDRVIVVRTD